jgi:Domain of unknown function (DUF4375)
MSNVRPHETHGVAMLADAFDRHARGELDVNTFDDELWLALCDVVNDRDAESFNNLPLAVRHYFASRYVECEVGNGGFAQAAFNVPHLFPAAREGYAALGLQGAVDLIAEAERLIAEGHAKFGANPRDDIGELFEEFAESALADLDARTEEVGWWATEKRVAYAVEHRASFESAA